MPPVTHLSLTSRHALVCGASQGIGAATARAFAAAGATLTLLARTASKLEAMVEPLKAAGAPAVHVLVADLDDREAFEGAVTAWLQAHGPVHIVVHNTGGPKGGPLLEASTDAIEGAIGRHLLTAHRLLQLTLPGMRSAGYGRFIQVLSTSVREPIDRLGVSNLTRAAVASWAKTMSRELPSGVTINNVLPGFTDTERLDQLMGAAAERTGTTPDRVREAWIATVPEGRLAHPDETASVILFLASEGASYVRGTSIPVDGGRLRSI
ncbi:MAG: SDR family oxidoreductase [Myxococcota bacterium]